MKYFLSFLLLLVSINIFSEHHKSEEMDLLSNKILMPVAAPGQIIVIYKGECPSGKIDESINIIKKTIAYERKNSPVSYHHLQVFGQMEILVR